MLVDGSCSLRPQVAVKNGEVERVDTVGAVYAAESHAASYVLGIVVSHVSMIVALEAESLPKGNLKVIAVGIPLTRYPPRGPGRALVSASGSYRG